MKERFELQDEGIPASDPFFGSATAGDTILETMAKSGGSWQQQRVRG